MTEKPTEPIRPDDREANQPDPWLRRFMDNPWILLVLGLVIPFLSYTVWGWIDLFNIPEIPLP